MGAGEGGGGGGGEQGPIRSLLVCLWQDFISYPCKSTALLENLPPIQSGVGDPGGGNTGGTMGAALSMCRPARCHIQVVFFFSLSLSLPPLQTGSETSVERLMKQIGSFMSEISDEFKTVVVEAIQSVCAKFPRKHHIIMSFLASMLREEGGFEYKKAIVKTVIIIIEENPEAKEAGGSL